MENAARLHAAGVAVGFTQSGDASHNARKIRQLAGNAVANGLPWADGLAGLTRVPAQALGVGDRLGTIALGMVADLVLCSGDPDRKSVVYGKSGSVRVDLGGRRIIKKKKIETIVKYTEYY